MQILQRTRPDKHRAQGVLAPKKRSKGFTLLETLIALGILASIAVQLLSVQSNTISVTQMARDNMRATWAMKSLLAQMQYVIEVYGLKALPTELEIPWSADKDFKIRLKSKEVSIEASKVFLTVMKLQKQLSMENPMGEGGASGDETDGQMKQLEPVFAILDTSVPKDIYRQVFVEVEWPDGDRKKQVSSGLFFIDQKGIKAMDGGGLGALGGAAGGLPLPGGGNP